MNGFNPFETGLGLSTELVVGNAPKPYGFNPFETGLGLSTLTKGVNYER